MAAPKTRDFMKQVWTTDASQPEAHDSHLEVCLLHQMSVHVEGENQKLSGEWMAAETVLPKSGKLKPDESIRGATEVPQKWPSKCQF